MLLSGLPRRSTVVGISPVVNSCLSLSTTPIYRYVVLAQTCQPAGWVEPVHQLEGATHQVGALLNKESLYIMVLDIIGSLLKMIVVVIMIWLLMKGTQFPLMMLWMMKIMVKAPSSSGGWCQRERSAWTCNHLYHHTNDKNHVLIILWFQQRRTLQTLTEVSSPGNSELSSQAAHRPKAQSCQFYLNPVVIGHHAGLQSQSRNLQMEIHDFCLPPQVVFVFFIAFVFLFVFFIVKINIPDFGLPPQVGLPIDQDAHAVHHVHHLQGLSISKQHHISISTRWASHVPTSFPPTWHHHHHSHQHIILSPLSSLSWPARWSWSVSNSHPSSIWQIPTWWECDWMVISW